MNLNYKVVFSFIGLLLMFNGVFMWLCLPFSLYYKEGDWPALAISGAITALVGFGFWFSFRKITNRDLKKRDGYLIVTLGWVSVSAFGALPYILSGAIPEYTNAYFETISGYSTTGATILTDIESVSKGILLWRSLTQWIGGMGIIVLTVAILPILGIGGMQLYAAEASGISYEKLKPRIQATAKRLWFVYLGLTLAQTIILMLAELDFYDAINHSFTTMATGGFSTKNDSAAHFSPFVQYVMIVFMFIAGISFTLNYFWLKGDFKKLWAHEEFRVYLILVLLLTVILSIAIFLASDSSTEKAFRDALFQIVSLLTTTGYVTTDYTQWSPFLTAIFFSFLFLGACAGSTSGGVKLVRHIILFKNSWLELKRQLHPSALIPVRFNGQAVSQNTTYNILAFIILYIGIFALSSLLVALSGVDLLTAIGAAATCLGNVGPGIGDVGPVDNFSHLTAVTKWFLAFLMLVGRLELFTVLILFTPYFWRKF